MTILKFILLRKKSFHIPKPNLQRKFKEDPEDKKEYQKIFAELSLKDENLDTKDSKKKIKLTTTKDSVSLEKISKRSISRIIAVQFNYLTHFNSDLNLEEFEKCIFELWQEESQQNLLNKDIFNYSKKIIKIILAKKEIIITKIIPYLQKNWSWERISLVNQSILITMVSCFLLKDIKNSAILFNEAVLLSKWFSDKKDYQFINGILDKIYKNELNSLMD